MKHNQCYGWRLLVKYLTSARSITESNGIKRPASTKPALLAQGTPSKPGKSGVEFVQWMIAVFGNQLVQNSLAIRQWNMAHGQPRRLQDGQLVRLEGRPYAGAALTCHRRTKSRNSERIERKMQMCRCRRPGNSGSTPQMFGGQFRGLALPLPINSRSLGLTLGAQCRQ